MRSGLLALWIATLGADRIDLLGGLGPFLLTPTLVLTPVILMFEALRLRSSGRLYYLPRATAAYALVVTLLLSVMLVSVFFSSEVATSASRMAHLIFHVYGAFLVALLLASSARDPGGVLARGAYMGLAIAFAFNFAQLLVWLPGVGLSERALGGVLTLDVRDYAKIFPRFSGPSLDQNRGGLLVLIFAFLVVRFAPPCRMRSLFLAGAALSVVATLSRSVMLACIGLGLILLLRRERFRIRPGRALGVVLGVSAVLAGSLAVPTTVEAIATALAPLGGRFSISEGSASIHVALIREGLAIATEGIQNSLIGIGFGSSYTVLEAFFPGNKYGNFHSYYITLLVESGVLALGLGLVTLLVPLATTNTYRPLIAAFFLFSLFYQAHTEAAFWLVLALAWMGVGNGRGGWLDGHPGSELRVRSLMSPGPHPATPAAAP